MALRTKSGSAARVTRVAFLLAVSLVLHYAESMIPLFQVLPGGKLGIANVVTLLTFSWYGFGTAFLVGILRCALSSIFSGAVTMFLYSGAGTVCSILTMLVFQKLMPRAVSVVGRSMLGAFAFNLGQILVCVLVLESFYIVTYLPVLTLFSAFCGLLTGILAKRTETIIHNR